MPKRPFIILCAAALLLAACSEVPEGEIDAGEGMRFVPAVADFLDNVGLGNAVAVDADGVPFYSYWIFPAELEAGEIAPARPIGAPYIQTQSSGEQAGKFGGAIGVGSVTPDGIFTRGAAAQVRDTPAGVTVPYDPATVQSLVGANPENTNGTDIAIDDAGGKHVVWAGSDGIWYAGGTDSFTAEQVYDYGFSVRRAGPIGRPAVAADEQGNAWVAYTVDAGGHRVEVATQTQKGWQTQIVDDIPACGSCPQPKMTEIGVTSAGPTVAYVDTSVDAVMAATLTGSTWEPQTVASGVTGDGLDMTVDADGNAHLTFYDGRGSVQLATQGDAGWTVIDVASADTEMGTDVLPLEEPTTGVTANDDGGLTVTYTDAGSLSLVSSEDGETFESVDIAAADTTDSAFPSVGVSGDGATSFLASYGVEGQDLRLGIIGDLVELQVAAPSPTPDVVAGPSSEGCGEDRQILLDLVTPAGQVFDTACLVAPADQRFTINYDNQSTELHNVALYVEQGGEPLSEDSATEQETGPVQQTLDAGPYDAGEYFFQCDVHPTTMVGTLAVVKARGGGNN